MNIYFGNTTFDQVRDRLGYQLTEDDRKTWEMYHSQAADLSDKPSCFHVFHLPPCIHFKGEDAKKAILKMFTPEKLVEPKGTFAVMEKK